MEMLFLTIALVLGFLTLLTLYRAIAGPTIVDRIIGTGVIGTKTTVILLLIGFLYRRVDMFVDIAIAYGLLSFIATLAASKFFLHRKTIVPGARRGNVPEEGA
ncbi:MAG: monovalent cation/H+ antiporter complex subunit F [Nitrospirota bacterium]|nr:monovalent cation/H+ antiporter complex subunit F [Nitrospirota bacterium]